MSNLNKVEENIAKGYYRTALKFLEKEEEASTKKDYLLALVYYNLDEKEKAYDFLLKIYFNSSYIFIFDNPFRRKVVDLLEKVTKDIDVETYEAIISKSTSKPNKDIDIIRAIYFGGAKYKPSMSEIVNKNKNHLSETLHTGDTIFGNSYFIQFYKNYSSFTPLLKSSNKISVGGGYFLNLDNYGLVVDPGHNFIENFYSAGRSFDDIDGIIVTHFHDDHFADLPSLLSLIFQSNKRINQNQKKYDLFLDIETYDKFKKFFLRAKNYKHRVKLISRKEMTVEIRKGLYLKPLKTNHPTIIKNSGVGILININKISTQIIITGDTGWNNNINENYKKQIIKNWNRILVAHISTLYNDEAISFVRNNPKFYDKHLCIHGLLKCIECIKPNVVILSEIGEELAPIVNDIAKLVSNKFGITCAVGLNEFIYNFD